ncbi:MAG: precorrin-8X methylmutase [Parvibaculaceae bacterium]
MRYLKDPAGIYAASFAAIRAEVDFSGFEPEARPLAERLVHACGMTDVVAHLRVSSGLPRAVKAALTAGKPVLADCEMVRAGIIARRLPKKNDIVCTLNNPRTAELARKRATTRSAAAVELWRSGLEGAVVVIGNAPTALFALLEMLEDGAPKPAAILGFPVGFVGAAESKAELHANSRGVPYATLLGRRGGSAMAAAALNGLLDEPA